MNTPTQNPEIGRSIATGAIQTNYHDIGEGTPVLLLHGSGPGVSAWANWRLLIQSQLAGLRMIAPDLAGFGYTTAPEGTEFTRQMWLARSLRCSMRWGSNGCMSSATASAARWHLPWRLPVPNGSSG